jgi:uncharacterized NAD-dependent epimerase/dehydratase family protein
MTTDTAPDFDRPYLLFLGDARDQLGAKTAQGVADWRPDWCVGQLRLAGCNADLGLDDLTIEQAAAKGARTLIIGVANAGGFLSPSWTDNIVGALNNGLDVASGLHIKLAGVDDIREAAASAGRRLFDVRHPSGTFDTGTGLKRPGKRLLTVGTDCSLGKMYTSLAIEKSLREAGVETDFRATGQTGIFIAGGGVSVDCVISDFISGATEALCPAADPDHWDIVEGQGSLFHPAYAGVSLGLLHGAQADFLVLCHEPTRTNMRNLPHLALPSLEDCLAANLQAARLTNPDVRFCGVAVNTSALDEAAGKACLAEIEARLELPAVDPLKDGVGRIVERLL